MCQYSSPGGAPTDWHKHHYGAIAIGAGCVIVEATAVSGASRITPDDLQLDSERHIPAFRELSEAIASRGAVPGLQLSHGGRKAARSSPWKGNGPLPAGETWQVCAPSPVPFTASHQTPLEMSVQDVKSSIELFARSAELAVKAGFRLIEVHGGHGRLVHSFLSPMSNFRTDEYGMENKGGIRYARELATALRAAVGSGAVLAFRLSCVDWLDGGLTIEDSVDIATNLKECGVDLIDCTSGGIVHPINKYPTEGYQVPFAREIMKRSGIPTAAVGEIKDIELAENILLSNDALVVMMGRKLLTDPYYPLRFAAKTGLWHGVPLPYQRALRRENRSPDVYVPEL